MDYLQNLQFVKQKTRGGHPFSDGQTRLVSLEELWELQLDESRKRSKQDQSKKTKPSYEPSLFAMWVATGDGIAFKANSTKFKLRPRDDLLSKVTEDQIERGYIEVDYDSLPGEEFDSAKLKCSAPYARQHLSEDEAIDFPPYVFLVPNKDLRVARTRFVYVGIEEPRREQHVSGKPQGMAFRVYQNTTEDQLRPLISFNLKFFLAATGPGSLSVEAETPIYPKSKHR